ncbi:Short-chain dehydrogenase/reductase SDR [Macrophomina phaseolina MS6]|uniref:Short-chain dehydrogenase/reductase SDR n=1 Tax=Macrophomina phaseolina (strain MS6) TaxID=1126212 RepID=K2RDL7_MACPH|nr:Short-chain dehydrogenase/reductase SDR [Macrophomina phaseolina MS6]
MALANQNILITGASMGIGAAVAERLASENANLILLARSSDKLADLSQSISTRAPACRVLTHTVDITDHAQLDAAIRHAVSELGPIDVLINNAGLALGAPNAFHDLSLHDIVTMANTNINGLMLSTYAVLNTGRMRAAGRGTILNVTSVTGLEVPPFPGEAVYHACKAAQEAFTNALRAELVGTNVRVLAVRPGVVATNFHEQRVGYNKGMYDDFMKGYQPLVADDVANSIAFMLRQREAVSIKALDIVPTAQRMLSVFDREWSQRNA